MAEAYSTLYKLSVMVNTTEDDMVIPTSDIVSVSIINNYDVAMFPIIRIRIYTDLSYLQKITNDPDNISVNIVFNGNVYDMNSINKEGNGSLQCVDGSTNCPLSLKAYIENKNTLTSKMDQYVHGIKKTSDLNSNNKVPITLYAYDAKMVNSLKYQAQGIYKNMDITSIIESMTNNFYYSLSLDPIHNQTKYDQILLPNISVKDTLSFFEHKYGLYPKGGSVYGERGTLYITNTDVENGSTPIPIYVESYKNSSDSSGLRKYSSTVPKYMFNTKAQNVSILTESDIEKVLNSYEITDINVNTNEAHSAYLSKIFTESDVDAYKRINEFKNIIKSINIKTPDTLHKAVNPFISITNAARITERVTKIDLSGVGFDAFRIDPRTRFNLIFESPIRGMSINQLYRASAIIHTFSNLSADLFVAQTTMKLCSN